MKRLVALFNLFLLVLTANAQSLGTRDIVFGTDLKATTIVNKAKTLAKKLANPNASNWRARGDQRRTYYFTDANETMPYRVCVPDAWDGESPMPMLLFLHGGWNDESSYLDQNNKQLVRLANQYGVLLVSPLGAHEGFGNFLRLPAVFGHDDDMYSILNSLTSDRIAASKLSEQDVINVIELVLAEYPVDRSAMFITGHSMGSGGTWYIGAKYADYWYGILPISGPFTMEFGYPWERLKNKPIYMTEGLQAGASLDGSRALYKFLNEVLQINITYKEVDGDHAGMFSNALDGCFQFIIKPAVRITQPVNERQHLYMAPTDEAQFDDINIEAVASAPYCNGKITRVRIYDGQTLLETKTEAPYTATITEPSATKHNLRVIATNDKGTSAVATCLVNYIASNKMYNLTQQLTGESSIPQGWSASNGKEKRIGGLNHYADGPRILHFTNSTRGCEYGMLVQSGVSKPKASFVKYGAEDSGSTLTLHAGRYSLKYKVFNWNQPEFSPVTVCIERKDGQEVASQTYTPNVNIGGNVANKFGVGTLQSFDFDIPETGDYVIAFYTDAKVNADFVLGRIVIQPNEFYTTGIESVYTDDKNTPRQIYDISGRRHPSLHHGINIVDGKKLLIK